MNEASLSFCPYGVRRLRGHGNPVLMVLTGKGRCKGNDCDVDTEGSEGAVGQGACAGAWLKNGARGAIRVASGLVGREARCKHYSALVWSVCAVDSTYDSHGMGVGGYGRIAMV